MPDGYSSRKLKIGAGDLTSVDGENEINTIGVRIDELKHTGAASLYVLHKGNPIIPWIAATTVLEPYFFQLSPSTIPHSSLAIRFFSSILTSRDIMIR